jgi:hypothetical protein
LLRQRGWDAPRASPREKTWGARRGGQNGIIELLNGLNENEAARQAVANACLHPATPALVKIGAIDPSVPDELANLCQVEYTTIANAYRLLKFLPASAADAPFRPRFSCDPQRTDGWLGYSGEDWNRALCYMEAFLHRRMISVDLNQPGYEQLKTQCQQEGSEDCPWSQHLYGYKDLLGTIRGHSRLKSVMYVRMEDRDWIRPSEEGHEDLVPPNGPGEDVLRSPEHEAAIEKSIRDYGTWLVAHNERFGNGTAAKLVVDSTLAALGRTVNEIGRDVRATNGTGDTADDDSSDGDEEDADSMNSSEEDEMNPEDGGAETTEVAEGRSQQSTVIGNARAAGESGADDAETGQEREKEDGCDRSPPPCEFAEEMNYDIVTGRLDSISDNPAYNKWLVKFGTPDNYAILRDALIGGNKCLSKKAEEGLPPTAADLLAFVAGRRGSLTGAVP